MRSSKFFTVLVLTLILVIGLSFGASADDTEYTFVQDDPNLATKFKIDKLIADGYATNDIYIGTTQAYLESIGKEADGATPIFKDGLAWNAGDILITNGKVGIVLCVGSADPWGYPSGSILDAGRVTLPEGAVDQGGNVDWTKAEFGEDTILTCQLLFNGWDAWAPVNAGMTSFRIVYYDYENKKVVDAGAPNGKISVEVFRKFQVPDSGDERDFDVYSYYTIDPGAEYAYMYDYIINKENEAVTSAINQEISLSNKGGVGLEASRVPALQSSMTYNFVTDDNGDITKQFGTSLITPGENRSMGSQTDAHPVTSIGGAPGYREHAFEDPAYDIGESRVYESYLYISDECSWQDTYNFYAEAKGLDTFNVSGSVTTGDGSKAKYATVVVYKDGAYHGWIMTDAEGNYTVDLPNESGDYTFAVEYNGTEPSAQSAAIQPDEESQTVNLETGATKVPVTFEFVDTEGNPVWGRVSAGTVGNAMYTGQTYFLSDNGEGHVEVNGSYGPGTVSEVKKGIVTAYVTPGEYEATAYGEGYNFYGKIVSATSGDTVLKPAKELDGSITVSGNTETATKWTVVVEFDNETPENWYTIDNHHHGQRMDAFTIPEIVAKAQVTAGLDVLTLDDHEYVIDNWPVYQWGRVMDIVGYMPSEEVTASWAHFDIMPLTIDAYEQHLDRNQENHVVNTNQSLKGILDQGHEFGTSIGAMHPTSSYGMLLADDNKTAPGGLVDDFDGLETQFSANHTNEAMAYWTAYIEESSHRNVEVERPHYIWASTDIHQSATSTGSGARRSYVFLENGDAISEENFDTFGLEFARSEALGHSFNSSGVVIIPATDGLMYGKTYWTDENGDFTMEFDISSLANLQTLYVFSDEGNRKQASDFNSFKYLYDTIDLTRYGRNSINDVKVELSGLDGKNWFAFGVVDEAGKMAFTNPIWVNGTDVKDQTITAVEFQTEPTLPDSLTAGAEITAPTSAGILITTPWSVRMVEDWALVGGQYGDKAVDGRIYTYRLTYEAPQGYVFDQALGEEKGWKVNADGTVLTYTVEVPCGETVGSFDDCVGKWMDEATRYLRARGIAEGVGDNLYNPDGQITRAEYAALIVRTLELKDNGVAPKEFADEADIPEWAIDEVDIASSYGILQGDDEGKCNPNAKIKREDMLLITYRTLDIMGMIPETIPDRDINLNDIDDLSDYAAEEVTALFKLGFINGNDDGTLNPLGTSTRAEGAQVLYNVLTK